MSCMYGIGAEIEDDEVGMVLIWNMNEGWL